MALLLLVALCSLLAASTDAQSCEEITAADLGRTDVLSTEGLIADREESGVQLRRFRIACTVTAGTIDLYREVSVVAEYIVEGASMPKQAQFEFSCTGPAPNQWNTVTVNRNDSFTVPPDIDNILFTITRRDCYTCVSPNTIGNSAPGNNHCLGCNFVCVGLRQCTSTMPSDCCNYYNQDGSCTLSCPTPFVPLANNTCGCRPGTIQLPGNICGCPPGFTGPQCDLAIDFCGPNSCMNSGTCSSTSNGFTCACPEEFTGARCETPSNPCTATPCANGGMCAPLGGSTFECTCPSGIEGNTCQTDINECLAVANPCENGATCTNSFGGYMCSCLGQWEGQNCDRCGIANCTLCSADGATCTRCMGGFITNSENTCSAECNLPSCELCSTDNLACRQCEDGFIVGLNNLCVRGTPRDINLSDIEIVAIVVGCTIALVLIVGLIICCLTWACKGLYNMGPPQYIKKIKVVKKKKKIIRKKKSSSAMQQTTMVNEAEDMEKGEENEGYENTEGGAFTLHI